MVTEKKETAKIKKTKKTAKKPAEKETKAKRYFEAVGRRKRAIARARLFTCQPFEGEEAKIIVNGKPYQKFFTSPRFSQMAASPLQRMKSVNRFEATVKVKGGGMASQAEATRHGLSRALVKFNPEFSKKLKRAGFLTRDSREVERKKPGLKKARRAAQWRKR